VPRAVSVRANYREDGSYLIRFESAILKDDGLPEDWRKEFAQGVHELAVKCLKADDLKNQRSDAGKKPKR
jgi:hypothetical protein